jgi:hypothetical protein
MISKIIIFQMDMNKEYKEGKKNIAGPIVNDRQLHKSVPKFLSTRMNAQTHNTQDYTCDDIKLFSKEAKVSS